MQETKFDTEAKSTGSKLKKFAASKNIAEDLSEEELAEIGADVLEGFKADKASLKSDKDSGGDRAQRWDDATKLAMQVIEVKNHPFDNASNVKFPLMTTAAIQFNARAYPAILNGGDVVKPKIIGATSEQKLAVAMRAAQYMSWQLCEQMQEWEEDTDRLLIMLPIFGTLFRKTWFSPTKRRPTSKILKPQDLVVNSNAQSLETAARITERFVMYKNEILSKIRQDLFRDVSLGAVDTKDGETQEDNAPYEMLEQHCWLDLDDDGFREPYTVTVQECTGTVLRIAARYTADNVVLNHRNEVVDIIPMHFYTKYGFIPALDGCFYDVGFADVLYPINKAINTNINQLIDGGTLQNSNTGFISKNLRLGSGPIKLKMGEYMKVNASGDDIRRGIVPMVYQGPSAVLFNLLGLLIEAGRDISGVKDIMTGDLPSGNTPAATTLAMIEQGMKVFSAIYKRIHRSMSKEIQKLRDINFTTLNPQTYEAVLDQPVDQRDFDPNTYDFYPVSDPTVVTDMQRLGKANFLMQFAADPMINPIEVRKRVLEAAQIEDIEKLLVPPPEQPPIELQIELAKEERAKFELMLKVREAYRADHKAEAEIGKLKSETMKNIADTQATTVGAELDIIQQQAEALYDDNSQQGGIPGMEVAPSNGGFYGLPEQGAGAFQGGVGGGIPQFAEPDTYAPVDPTGFDQMSDPTGGFGPQL